MARPSKHDGVLYQRGGSRFWWMRYRDHSGTRRQEPTGEADWHEAQKKLRERLQARDDDVLDVIRKGEQLLFKEWADWVLVQFCYSWTYILGSADFSGPCANWNLV